MSWSSSHKSLDKNKHLARAKVYPLTELDAHLTTHQTAYAGQAIAAPLGSLQEGSWPRSLEFPARLTRFVARGVVCSEHGSLSDSAQVSLADAPPGRACCNLQQTLGMARSAAGVTAVASSSGLCSVRRRCCDGWVATTWWTEMSFDSGQMK